MFGPVKWALNKNISNKTIFWGGRAGLRRRQAKIFDGPSLQGLPFIPLMKGVFIKHSPSRSGWHPVVCFGSRYRVPHETYFFFGL